MSYDKYKTEVEELLDSINTDFYLKISDYEHYCDICFETNKLSISELFLIAEATAHKILDMKDFSFDNTVPINALCGIILDRINGAPPRIMTEIYDFVDHLAIKDYFYEFDVDSSEYQAVEHTRGE
jgi:hypothetical protein